jgi:hypothetical protein
MEEESSPGYVLILIDMVNTIGIKSTGSADEAMDFVALFQEELGKVASVLTRNAGYQSASHLSSFKSNKIDSCS